MWQLFRFTAPEEKASASTFSTNCSLSVRSAAANATPAISVSVSAAIPSTGPPAPRLAQRFDDSIEVPTPLGSGDPACPECPSRETFPSAIIPPRISGGVMSLSQRLQEIRDGFERPFWVATSRNLRAPFLLRSVRLARAVPAGKTQFLHAADRHARGNFRRHGVVPGHLRRSRGGQAGFRRASRWPI